jgi:hypothetical protein
MLYPYEAVIRAAILLTAIEADKPAIRPLERALDIVH